MAHFAPHGAYVCPLSGRSVNESSLPGQNGCAGLKSRLHPCETLKKESDFSLKNRGTFRGLWHKAA
jgi:hypothetical protein